MFILSRLLPGFLRSTLDFSILLVKLFQQKFPSNLVYDDILSEIQKPDGTCSYQRFFKIFVSCVNPRSFQGLSNLKDEETFINRQFADLETVIKRLVFGTTFEIEGWKRLLPAREIFKKLSLNIDYYQLEMAKIEKIDFEVRFN